ncbi:hypothetical protein ACX80L_16200 [Arthrobacter sp. MDT1-48-3]
MIDHATTSPELGLTQPYLDVDEQRNFPVPHRYVHGGFKDGATRFSFYMPAQSDYQNRFFQYITPVPLSETLSQQGRGEEDKISFSIESGAILVESNARGPASADPTYGAYRANAAVAKFARRFAEDAYGTHTCFGYAFGGSGGAFRTIAGAENTHDVWDGFVPYVVGSPMSLPNVFTVRLHAKRVLRDCLDDIVDALEPGGSGDPYATLGAEQAAALREATSMGFPLRSWFAHETMGMHAFAVIYPVLRMIDPTYFDDFWTTAGYLGADPESSIHEDRVVYSTRISELLSLADLRLLGIDVGPHPGESTGGADDGWLGDAPSQEVLPAGVRLGDHLTQDPFECELVLGGEAAGQRLVVLRVVEDIAILGPVEATIVRGLRVGDEVTLDNSGFLAAQTYHRHQMPGPDFPVWNQFRDERGEPLYPQRPVLIGPMLALSATGALQTGTWAGKMIIVESLLDREAFPWQADWYRRLACEHFGDATEDHLRVWMVDNALHGDFEEQEHPTHTVSYLGVLHEALRQLAAWVEQDREPAASSAYAVCDGQINLLANATERGGVQPVLTLHADGTTHIVVAPGERVSFLADAATPGTARITAFEWDLTGRGRYEPDDVTMVPADHATSRRSAVFTEPGEHFVAVRVTARQDPAQRSPFARLQNVARARVTVRGYA